ncbi:hypothetical protein EPIR_3164 [Erwinia piriflorinigrans CFBP 5888]|uniref:Uncharacterized protein n=2 Tax=Erwinia piriflorinigrans TaxID=665097 RepID=V5ZBZ1_9GAMM|nr:hypothetical protein EPIR_3164 [Erwinia piriflorinigrans CFBP 5888]
MRLRFEIINIILLLLFVVVVSYFIFYWTGGFNNYNKKNYECQAVFKLETPEFSMPAVASISVLNNKGSMMFGGPVYEHNSLAGAVSRRFEFNVEEEYGSMLFHIHKTIKLEKDSVNDSVAEEILPGFLTVPSATIYFKIFRVNEGIFFMRDNRPLFYCKYI